MWTSIVMTAVALAGATPSPGDDVELSLDIWDWTAPAQDLEVFRAWTADLAGIGFNCVEISVPWRELEPRRGELDLRWLADRLAICEEAGLRVRLRINSYYGGATPEWYDGAVWRTAEGEAAPQAPPSILDETFWRHYGAMCTAIAELCRGRDVYHNAFIGIHAELKFADWWHFDEALLAAWREAIAAPRPDWLRDVVEDDAALPDRPEIPENTNGTPDTSAASRAVIAFREWCWREAVRRFEEAIRRGDPDARISAPLGESYRRQSAHMSNHDYWGLTRGAQQVVHSYDFFWHGKDPSWMAAAAVAAFRGISGQPTMFEFDSPSGLERRGYSHAHLLALGRQAMAAGAGLKIANRSYEEALPSTTPIVVDLVRLWRSGAPSRHADPALAAPRGETVLLFVSKWAGYSYREPDEWLHAAQFGMYKLLRDLDLPVRVICEENLGEDLRGYRALVAAFSPRELMRRSARERFAGLELPLIEDVPRVPARRKEGEAIPETTTEGVARIRVASDATPTAPLDLKALGAGYAFGLEAGDARFGAHAPGRVVFGFPVGALYAAGGQDNELQGAMLWALDQATR